MKTSTVDNLPVTEIGKDTWSVPLRSQSNVKWRVTLNANGYYICGCPAHSVCSHIRSVQRYRGQPDPKLPPLQTGRDLQLRQLKEQMANLARQINQIADRVEALEQDDDIDWQSLCMRLNITSGQLVALASGMGLPQAKLKRSQAIRLYRAALDEFGSAAA